MSSFQGVGIEGFHYIIQRCPHFRELDNCIQVSSFQDAGIEEFHVIILVKVFN